MPTTLTRIDTFNVPFLWPIKLESGRENLWLSSAHYAASKAMEGWVRAWADTNIGHYRLVFPNGDLGSPEWPTEDFQGLVRLAFKDRVIMDLDHRVLKALRGEF